MLQFRRLGRRIAQIDFRTLARTIITRTYAASLMLILCFAGFRASVYLYNFVASPARTPKELIHPGGRAGQFNDDPSLAVSQEDAVGFHLARHRAITDPQNGCTIAGCHNALPHGPRTKVPAFANMHVSFLDCTSCHIEVSQRPVKSVWISRQSGKLTDTPAVLKLAKLFCDNKAAIEKQPESVHTQIFKLGQQVLQIRGTDPALRDVLLQMETAQPGSPVWRASVERLSAEVDRHKTLDYGAKLVPESLAAGYLEQYRETAKLVPSFLATVSNSRERKVMQDRIHAGLSTHPPGCIECHAKSPGQLDFVALGYLPDRARSLGDMQLAGMLEQVRLGGQFRLPTLVEEPHAETK